MLDRVLATLIASRNEAADDVLLETIRVGDAVERGRALGGLLARKTKTGIFGLLLRFDSLPHDLKLTLIQRAGDLVRLLPDAARHRDPDLRVASIRMIALARLGRLSYVLTENLHHAEDRIAAAAVEALLALARHAAAETRSLRSGRLPHAQRREAARDLIAVRHDIEGAVARAVDDHRGGPGGLGATGGVGGRARDLTSAALILADNPGSRTAPVLSTSRAGGVSPIAKRLLQSPVPEHIDALLLGATHGQTRGQLAPALAHAESPPVLDAFLRRTHSLHDSRLAQCVAAVTRGVWWLEGTLAKDLARHGAADAVRIADWLAASGLPDAHQDEKLLQILVVARNDMPARLRLLRIAMSRPRGGSTLLLRRFLDDPDESIQRLAAREFVRRRPLDYATILLGLMKTAPPSVRRVAGRAVSGSAFDHFFDRFDRLDPPTRQRAGRAVFKMLADAPVRLARRLRSGDAAQRVKALTITGELGLADLVHDAVLACTSHEDSHVRSKAITLAGTLTSDIPATLLEAAIADPDARVRANAIEVVERNSRTDLLPAVAQRVGSSISRERANAIKALYAMKVEAATPHLLAMLQDPRPDHRISALWAARHAGVLRIVQQMIKTAQEEPDPRVKRYAVASVRQLAAQVQHAPKKAG